MKKSPYYLFAALALFAGCNNDDAATPASPTTQVDIRITNPDSANLQGVEVRLYKTHLDWTLEQNAVQTATTAANGNARFTYLTEAEYYVSAAKNGLSNWEANNKLVGIQPNKAHSATIALNEYQSYKLGATTGRIWQIYSYKRNGTDLTNDTTLSCLTDNVWVFYKGDRSGRFERLENAKKCNATDPETENGSWKLNDEGTALDVPENGQVVTYTLHHLSATTLRISKQEGADLVEFTLITP